MTLDVSRPTERDTITAALDAAEAALQADIHVAGSAHEQTVARVEALLLAEVAQAWAWAPGQDETTAPVPVAPALRRLNGTARHSIGRLTPEFRDTEPGPAEYVLRPERVRVVVEARPARLGGEVRDCAHVNPARFFAARRLLAEAERNIAIAAITRDAAIATARRRHAETVAPLHAALGRQINSTDEGEASL